MSDRVDEKLVEVPVAKYAYRHEAEFAAGFLDEAGIPYRLQIDDPVLGMAISAAATIWVLRMHERDARELLELDEDDGYRAAPDSRRGDGVTRAPRDTPSPPPPYRSSARGSRGPSDRSLARRETPGGLGVALGYRERITAVVGGIVIAAIGDAVFGSGPFTLSQAVPAAIVIVLAGVALVGRAPKFLRDLLTAFSGGPP